MTIEFDAEEIWALIWIENDPAAFGPTIESLQRAHPSLWLAVGGPRSSEVSWPGSVHRCGADRLDGAIWETSNRARRHVLVITGPVIVPAGFLDRAALTVVDDLRVATVSFLSNSAGLASVPNRNRPMFHQVGPHDEVSITRLLRELDPSPVMAPSATPSGEAVLISRFSLAATQGFADLPGGSSRFRLADFALAAARRGFVNVVDTGTYVTRAWDLVPYTPDPLEADGLEKGYLLDRHPFISDRLDAEHQEQETPLGLGVNTAIVKIRGLRIAIDGRDIGTKEMGTQVQILSLVRELAARSDVERVQVGIPGDVPAYALPYLNSPKIAVAATPDLEAVALDHADVLHRPSQPSNALPFESWRQRFARVLVTLQDLIAYQVGAYHGTSENWTRYRNHLRDGVLGADGVVAISEDTLRHVAAEMLPIESQRLFLVANGTDHLTGAEAEEAPLELMRRGFLSERYVLVLGTNYGHKNRDLAIRSWRMLRHTYPDLALVLAGALVPDGSSRLAEHAAVSDRGGLFVLPDVTSAERNWLIRHALCLIYPSSAEGFGLVPFEAARFGTPTVSVSFSPIRELNGGAPVWADSWTPEALASAAGSMIADPSLAAAQVRATLSNADTMKWSDTASGLVVAYRTVLSMPSRWQAPR